MLGVRDIMVRIRTLTNGSVPDPDPTPDTTPFFSDFKDAKTIIIFSYLFLITYPQAHYLQS